MSDIESIARRHDVPVDAAKRVLGSLARNSGRMAQFDHPALGGMGQWYAGGMTMVGDMFNDALKARVAALCADLAPLAETAIATDQSNATSGAWWPSDLGRPSNAGSQNDARYAVFPHARRLALETDGRVRVYDTGDHQIAGVSQQQAVGRDLAFTSQLGTIRVHELKEVLAEGASPAPARGAMSGASPETPPHEDKSRSVSQAKGGERLSHDVLATLERLYELHRKGVLTDEEFAAKKTELLSRI